jgi:hypothetical protein
MKRSFTKFSERLEAIGLFEKVLDRTLQEHVTLRALYEEPAGRGSSTIAARRVVYLWLMKKGKSINEVARLFDRAPSGVLKLTRGSAK